MHFIVVDPNVAFATLLTEELRSLGYETTACGSCGEALAAARALPPDMALLDMALAEPGALALARQLRDLHPETRLIFIPLMGEDLKLNGEAPPYQGVLPKPFFLPELPQHIEAALATPLEGGYSRDTAHTSTGTTPVGGPAGASVTPLDLPPAGPDEATSPAPPSAPRLSREFVRTRRTQVVRIMQGLMSDVGADGVLLTGEEGVLAWVGTLAEEEVDSISHAVLHGWQTSAEVARILGREQLRFEQSIAGGNYLLYALSVQDAILAVTVDGAAALGLLRHRARSAAQKIAQLCTA